MTFQERINLSNKMEAELVAFLSSKGFKLEKTGYEKYISQSFRSQLRTIHSDPSVSFLRYLPDFFAKYNDKYFFIEFKVMNTLIRLDSRVKELKEKTGIEDLSKANIGVVETAAVKNYTNIQKMGVKILVMVFCTFHEPKLLLDWENNLQLIHQDRVRIGNGNASFTPFTNIHLDKMDNFPSFLKEKFDIEVTETEIKEIETKIIS